MTENIQHWSGVPYLDVLRPPVGWKVDLALIATYSADLVAVTAALLAAAGLDDDERRTQSSITFANAYEQLRGKFLVVLQSGRISIPRKHLPLAPLLDRLIVQVPQDEATGSWHPKAIVVRLQCKEIVEWRFWLGSRNLTADFSWDTGLVLRGTRNSGRKVPGLPETAMWLLAREPRLTAGRADQLQRELKTMKWEMPEGVEVEAINHRGPGAGGGFPAEPKGLKKLFVISPFLDRKGVEHFGRWGTAHTYRTLLSTQMALKKMVALDEKTVQPFKELLWLETPELSGETIEDLDYTDEVLQSRGLHAKIIMASHDEGSTLWLGSSNATSRGWQSRNFEINARLKVKPSVIHGLKAFVGLGKLIGVDKLREGYEIDETAELLEQARQEVVTKWHVTHTQHENGNILSAASSPHPANKDIMLEIALLSATVYVPWPRGTDSILLAPVPLDQQSDLLKIKLTLKDRRQEWVQHTPQTPPISEERDRAAIARQLTPKAFLSWLKAILEEDVPIDGDDGGGGRKGQKGTSSPYPQASGPTLESMMKAWGKNRELLRAVQDKVNRYLREVELKERSQSNKAEIDALKEFVLAWEVVKRVLV